MKTVFKTEEGEASEDNEAFVVEVKVKRHFESGWAFMVSRGRKMQREFGL